WLSRSLTGRRWPTGQLSTSLPTGEKLSPRPMPAAPFLADTAAVRAQPGEVLHPMNVTRFAVFHPVVALAVTAALVLFGLAGYFSLGLEENPTANIPIVT